MQKDTRLGRPDLPEQFILDLGGGAPQLDKTVSGLKSVENHIPLAKSILTNLILLCLKHSDDQHAVATTQKQAPMSLGIFIGLWWLMVSVPSQWSFAYLLQSTLITDVFYPTDEY